MEDKQEFYFVRRVRYRGEPHTDNIFRTEAIEWPKVLKDFEEFLRGCGYVFHEGEHLDFVQNEKETEE